VTEDRDNIAESRARLVYRELQALLREALRGKVDLPGGRPIRLQLSFEVRPFPPPDEAGEPGEAAFAADLLQRVERAAQDEADRRAPFPQGRVRCFWCGSFDCAHAIPPGSRSAFAGYGPTGLPIWKDLATLALDRRDPRIDDLYADPPVPIAVFQTGRDLVSDQLVVYGKGSGAFRILGQVAVGYLGLRVAPRAERIPVAITIQAVDLDRGGPRPVRLNVIGRLPDGTDLWRVLEEEPDSRLADALRVARARLEEIPHFRRHRGPSREKLALGALSRLARNLDRIFRQKGRRTKHAEDRHQDRERPAAAALRDAIAARPDAIYRDVHQSTWVVIGPRSRVHFFNDAGQHVTSVVYPGETVRRRTLQGKWRAVPPDSIRGFQEALARSADASR
jgi:hypothetical protein